MHSVNWRTLTEIVGLASVVASLVFVGLEIRQASEATKSATVAQIQDSYLQINLASATNKDLTTVIVKLFTEPTSLTATEREMVDSYYRSIFYVTANAYYQFRIGILDNDLWQSRKNDLNTMLRREVTRAIWEKWKYLYDPAFVEYAEKQADDA